MHSKCLNTKLFAGMDTSSQLPVMEMIRMQKKQQSVDTSKTAKIIVIGSGFGGIAAAVRSKQSGENDLLLLERSNDMGGVWRDNCYPGAACDVQSHLYSFSFAPNPNWTRDFSQQAEIHAYLKDTAKKFGVLPHVRFNTEVQGMEWFEDAGEWAIRTTQGQYRARYIVLGMGSLSDPLIPEIEGQDQFRGDAFHSAQWPADYDIAGRRVAVIGTGASALQFIPAIQPDIEHMTVFQRTPPWVMPRHDSDITDRSRSLFKRFPLLQRLARLRLYLSREATAIGFRNPKLMRHAQSTALKHMHSAVTDPDLRKKLTPNYTFGCKRILISNTYYPALAADNVDVESSGVTKITKDGIVDANGVERKVDTIIYGAGFKVKDLPYSHYIFGRQGKTLAQSWGGSPTSVAGTTVNGFPNLFILHGPNVGLGHTSVIYMLEAQVEHALSAIKQADERNCQIVEPSAEAQQKFTKWLDKQMMGTVWTAGGCNSWYLDDTGRNSSLWPSYTFLFRNRVAKARKTEYAFRSVAS